MSNEVMVAIVGLFSTLATGVGTWLVTRANNKKELAVNRETYVDNQLKGLIDMYKSEVHELREEIHKLTEENKELRTEIINLREELVKGGYCRNEQN